MVKNTLAFALTLVAAVPALAQNLPPYKAGFPLTLAGQGGVSTKPALADLKIPGDTVGVRSIVWVGNNGNLHVVHRTATPTIWAEAPGFPVLVGTPSGSAADPGFRSSVAVGDLTGDGIPEIVVGYGPINNTVPGGVKAFRNTGGLPLWSRTSLDVNLDGRFDPVVGTPAIGDVDGDGQNDVVWGAADHRVYFVNGSTGVDKPNWPRFMNDTVLSSPVLHDMDGDGRREIIMGVDANANATFGTPQGGCLHVMPGAQPAIGGGQGYPVDLPGFPKCVDQVIHADPVVGDIDGDGRPDIVHGTGSFFAGRTKAAYAWKCDGTAVAGWPVTLTGETLLGTSLALANLDTSTPALEVVLTADNVPPAAAAPRVYAIRGNGTVMPGFPKAPKSFDGGSFNAGSPVVADVLGADTALEILVPTNTDIAIFDTAGTQLTNPPVSGAFAFYTATTLTNVGVADLDPGDAKIEVVAISAAPFPSATDTVIHVWNPISRAATPPWGQYRGDERRTGLFPGTGPCRSYGACTAPPAAPRFNTITPCRVVDTRGGAVPIGGPALASDSLRDFVLRGKCNVPAGAKALSLNLTVVSPGGQGFVQFSPSCQMGTSSTINFGAAQTRANNAVLPLGDTDGVLTAKAFVTGGGSVHLLIDVNGYFQ